MVDRRLGVARHLGGFRRLGILHHLRIILGPIIHTVHHIAQYRVPTNRRPYLETALTAYLTRGTISPTLGLGDVTRGLTSRNPRATSIDIPPTNHE